MGTVEIERKFLVRGESWRGASKGVSLRQGFLVAEKGRTVRVRIGAGKAFLTVKSPPQGVTRKEFEYEIPVADAEQMLELCRHPAIVKKRYFIAYRGMMWEVDEFLGQNKGLVVAEIELQSEGQHFSPPPWLGEEVTHDPRYLNANLVKYPYEQWEK